VGCLLQVHVLWFHGLALIDGGSMIHVLVMPYVMG
jgi:hypothetical protein